MKLKKQKIYEGMWLGSIILLLTTISFMGITSLLDTIRIKSVEAGQKTGDFWEDLVETHDTAPIAYKTHLGENKAIKQAPINKMTKEWALEQWRNRYGEKVAIELDIFIKLKESNWNRNAFHCNNDGSVDLFWYQINSQHIESGRVTLQCAVDPECATKFAMDLYDAHGWCPWYGAKALGFCK